LVVLAWTPLAAQDTPLIARSGSGRPLVQPEGTYVFQHLPHSDIIFEGQIAPRLIIVDSIGRATRNVLLEMKPPSWGYQISTTPMVRLRMFDETSNPVRTPSYMPKVTVQLARFRNLSPSNDVDAEEFNRGPIEMWLVDAVPFGHHSNGQDGCLFTSQARNADGDCVEVAPTPEPIVNKKDGSFSTNYIQAMAFYGRMYLDAAGAAAGEYATRWDWRIGAGMQFNPEGYVGGSIKPELSELYGPTRVLFSGLTARRDLWRCGRLAGEVHFQYMTTPPPDVSNVITQLEGACHPRNWGGAGVFVRFYHGQDYYNLGFAESITRVMFGMTLQKENFLSFRISPI
jgi:hypothetical protein